MEIFYSIFACIIISCIGRGFSVEYRTKYVGVLFRHGDRTPEVLGNERFPNDPYVNFSFFPEGPGGLTNIGKRREYAFGKLLRKQYDDFLGRIYTPSEVIARSMSGARMIMSLSLVMAGLYPPAPEQMWEPSLNWQPIVISTPSANNNILKFCSRYYNGIRIAETLPKYREQVERISRLFPELTKRTARKFTRIEDAFLLNHALIAESSMGLELPAWTQEVFPNGALRDASILVYRMINYSDEAKRLSAGKVLRVIVESMLNVSKGISRRKLDLFSANELFVASLLITLGIYEPPHVPTFSSAVIIELVEHSDNYFVKVFHYQGISSKMEEETLPGCKSPCPLKDFLTNMINVIATDEDIQCQ